MEVIAMCLMLPICMNGQTGLVRDSKRTLPRNIFQYKYAIKQYLAYSPPFYRCLEKGGEQRVRRKWARLQFRMELAAEHERVVLLRKLCNFHEDAVGRRSRKDETVLNELLHICRIDFVPMTMALKRSIGAVRFARDGTLSKFRGVRAQAHRAAIFPFCDELRLIRHHVYHRVGRIRVNLDSMSVLQAEHGTCVFDDEHVHAVTEAKIRNL